MKCWRLGLAGIVLWMLTTSLLHGQVAPPKREFRAAWVVTLANLDWPSSSSSSSAQQKKDFIRMLDRLEGIGMNAVVVQVRPAGDAFYPSKLAPWSQYLTGKQGRAPSPYYDPLAFMIKECHLRNMEFHAWFNPFRAVSHTRFCSVTPDHPSNQHPDWCFQYGETRFYDPGIPEVRDHIIEAVMEVVEKYDVDGIHLDDYFYPYPKIGEEIGDASSFARYGKSFTKKADWRRNNIDSFVEELSQKIRAEKGYVKFGISPFGVWRNQSEDWRGSETRALAAYDGLYADTRKWIKKGWVDYLAPQLYWSMDNPRASFKLLIDWWDELDVARHIYIGHAPYLMQREKVPSWAKTSEFVQQCNMSREKAHVMGNIWFRASSLQANPQGFSDTLSDKVYLYPALPPSMPWLDSIPPLAPRHLTGQPMDDGMYLMWDPPGPASDGQEAAYYIVYRYAADEMRNLDDPRTIRSITRDRHYLDITADPGKSYLYVVTALDRSHNECERFSSISLVLP